jgi:hypothetical protein
MKTIYSPDGSESRIIHDVDYPGYRGLGWRDEKPVDPPALDNVEPALVDVEPVPEPTYELPSNDDDLAYMTEEIKALTWRQQRALLSAKQQSEKPDGVSWEDWAISLLVEVPNE